MNSPYELAMASLLGLGTTSSNDCYRHLITTFLAVCERGTGEIQGNLRRQGFVGNERFLRARSRSRRKTRAQAPDSEGSRVSALQGLIGWRTKSCN